MRHYCTFFRTQASALPSPCSCQTTRYEPSATSSDTRPVVQPGSRPYRTPELSCDGETTRTSGYIRFTQATSMVEIEQMLSTDRWSTNPSSSNRSGALAVRPESRSPGATTS